MNPLNQKDKKNDNIIINKRIILVITLLFNLVAISSCILGCLLSKWTFSTRGLLTETIILSPTDPSSVVPLSLSGTVHYNDGTPCIGKTVELHNEPRVTTVDKNGYFFFHNIDKGNHKIIIVDDNESEIASVQLNINEKYKSAEFELQTDGIYKLSIPVDVLLTEIELRLDDKNNLSIDNGLCIIQTDGRVSTKDGNAEVITSSCILTGLGNVVLDDGTINMPYNGVLLNDGTYITSDKEIIYQSDNQTLPEGISLTEDDQILLKDGSIITLDDSKVNLPDGSIIDNSIITLPNGMIIDNNNNTIITKDGTFIDPNIPGTLDDGTIVNIDGTIVTKDGRTISPRDGRGYIIGDIITRPLETSKNGGKVIIKEDDSDIIWTQKSIINLFNDYGKLFPGIIGIYKFKVENTQDFDVIFTMTINEEEHPAGNIPFEYRLYAEDKKPNNTDNPWLTATQLKETIMKLSTDESSVYMLEWRWPFDSGDDDRDTRLGTSNDLIHTINITIKVEQLS